MTAGAALTAADPGRLSSCSWPSWSAVAFGAAFAIGARPRRTAVAAGGPPGHADRALRRLARSFRLRRRAAALPALKAAPAPAGGGRSSERGSGTRARAGARTGARARWRRWRAHHRGLTRAARPGTIVAGYRVDGVLGEGGMGVVYRATQLSLNRTVALKILAAELSDDGAFRERFRREGLLQAIIDHPHIVTVYEAGETEHGLFLAMRLVRGPTLKDMILAGEARSASARS